MARIRRYGIEAIYTAAERWRDTALRDDGSLFTPGARVWSRSNAAELVERISGEEAPETFEIGLRDQLAAAAGPIYQLTAEALFVYFLVTRHVGAKKKRQLMEQVLSWSPAPVKIPPELSASLDDGLVNPGVIFNIAKPHVLNFLMAFIVGWKDQTAQQREAALRDPWVFRQFVFTFKVYKAQNMREALLHLVHPDTFEAIVSGKGGDKSTLAKAFANLVTDKNADLDHQIAEIRAALEPQYGRGFNFYADEVRPLWKEKEPGGEEKTTVTAVPTTEGGGALFSQMSAALRRRGQLILYGPPGTGKTFSALRFAVWWLAKENKHPLTERVLREPSAFEQVEREYASARTERRAWWVVANPKEWSWDRLERQRTVNFRYGRLERNYPQVQEGDLVIGYSSTPDKRVAALARVQRGLHTDKDQQQITLSFVATVGKASSLTFDDLTSDPLLRLGEPARFRCQGTLFALTEEETDYLLALLVDRDARLEELLREPGGDTVGPLTRVTFHPTYGYEEFVEGYRPVEGGAGQLALRLVDGVFKRVCRAAGAQQRRTFLVLIDEINRGNLPKIFGELVTLLEGDKRKLTVVLPQSHEVFSVPPNVYVLGTMNTADRSIRLLDAALRRRFAFIELMPQPELLGDTSIGGLALGSFLRELNARVVRRVGREKQIGHSFLMRGGMPIDTAEEFHARFIEEILPLLQEYAYEDYGQLREYLGPDLVDADARQITVSNPDALIASLQQEYQPSPPPAP